MDRDQIESLAVDQLMNLFVARTGDGSRSMGTFFERAQAVGVEGEHRLTADAMNDSEGAARASVIVNRTGLARTPTHQESLVGRSSVQEVATVGV